MSVGLEHYLVVSALLFALGLMGVIVRRNLLIIYMCIELMLNSANLALVAFSRFTNNLDGQVFVFLGKRRNKVKLLVWDRHGFWLLYKRLEGGRFPQPEALAARGLSMGELTAWLEGIDLTRARRLRVIDATRVA